MERSENMTCGVPFWTRYSRIFIALSPLLLGLILSKQLSHADQAPKPKPKPNASEYALVLIVVVDQFSDLHLKSFGHVLQGGIAQLLADGVSYSQAFYRHANTETCPGHATIISGTHPRVHGIVGNDWHERATGAPTYCVADKIFERSPLNLKVSTLGDWLKVHSPKSRVFAVSGKDRAAILLGGKTADGVAWFDVAKGNFRTSSYYKNTFVSLAQIVQAVPLNLPFGGSWSISPQTAELVASKKVTVLNGNKGEFQREPPYSYGSLSSAPDQAFFSSAYKSPTLDTLTGIAARTILEKEELGSKGVPDLLAVSFSSLDTVGHAFGPTSLEALDTLLNVDREVGALIDAAHKKIGKERVLIALTSDHGVLPLPEAHRHGSRLTTEEIQCVQRAGNSFRNSNGDSSLRPDFTIDESNLNEGKRKTVVSLRRSLASTISKCPGVAGVWTTDDLLSDISAKPSWPIEAFRLGYYHERSPDLTILYGPGKLTTSGSYDTGHGTPYPYDSHVPLVIRARGVRARKIDTTIGIEQLAPTLASVLGVTPGEVPMLGGVLEGFGE